MTGSTGYYAGLCAEGIVARAYLDNGYALAAQRWRGKRGEIDLIVERDNQVVFVEVKKSRSFERAAARLSAKQQARIYGAAEEYLATSPHGLATDSQFDVALVNNSGGLNLLQNVIGFQ